MLATVAWVKNLKKLITYHEQKVDRGVAERIHAGNFLLKPDELTKEQIYDRFNHSLSCRADGSPLVLHAHVNFHPDDTPRLSVDTLRHITTRYMEAIGMSSQPYVAYRHVDAAHPHCHIIAPAIDPGGYRICFPVKLTYRQFVKGLEQEYRLTGTRRRGQTPERSPDRPYEPARKVEYGRMPTVPAAAKAIEAIVDNYRFNSLESFNAALREYNVEVREVVDAYKTHSYKGLVFSVLRSDGTCSGGFFPASLFDCKPTFANLEKKFRENAHLMEQSRAYLITRIKSVTQEPHAEIGGYLTRLRGERISTIIRHDKSGKVDGFAYVDHANRCVFQENELPEWCSAKVALTHFGLQSALLEKSPAREAARQHGPIPPAGPDTGKGQETQKVPAADGASKRARAKERLRLSVATDLPEGSPLAAIFRERRRIPPQEKAPERNFPFRSQERGPD
jgi:hypothetical protein